MLGRRLCLFKLAGLPVAPPSGATVFVFMTKEEIRRKRAKEYRDPRTLLLQEIAKRRDGYRCQNRECADPNNPDTKKQAHHLRYPSVDPWIPLWETPLTWLTTLCIHCHSTTHGQGISQETFLEMIGLEDNSTFVRFISQPSENV